MEVEPETGIGSRLSGGPVSPVPSAGDAGSRTERTTAFVAEHRAMLLGDGNVDEMVVSDVQQLAVSSHVQYQQVRHGLPVWGARLSVHMGADRQVRQVENSFRPRLQLDTTPALTPGEALTVARGETGKAELRGEPAIALGIVAGRHHAQLASRIEIATAEPADWGVPVDARTSAVLTKRDRLRRAVGEGVVVAENPFTTPATEAQPLADLLPGGSLRGSYAAIDSYDARGPKRRLSWKPLSSAADGRFLAPSSDPRFDEQMLYYHAGRAHDFFSRTLGFRKLDVALKLHAHVPRIGGTNPPRPWDGAAYSPAGDTILFGDGTGSAGGGFNPTSRDRVR